MHRCKHAAFYLLGKFVTKYNVNIAKYVIKLLALFDAPFTLKVCVGGGVGWSTANLVIALAIA